MSLPPEFIAEFDQVRAAVDDDLNELVAGVRSDLAEFGDIDCIIDLARAASGRDPERVAMLLALALVRLAVTEQTAGAR